MPLAPDIGRSIDLAVDACAGDLLALSRRIHAHPELRFEEHKASGWLADFLRRARTRGRAGRRRDAHGRAFARDSAAGPGSGPPAVRGHSRRVRRAARRGPRVRAQPHRGRGRRRLRRRGRASPTRSAGDVVLLGTPAEEGGGGKIEMIKAGVFEGVDAAMMFHPFDRDLLMHPTLASLWLIVRVRGTPVARGRGAARRSQRPDRLPRHVPPDRRAAGSLPRRRPRPRVRHRRRSGRQHHPRARRLRVQRPRARRRRARTRARDRRALREGGGDGERRRGHHPACARATATWSTTWPSRAASGRTSRASAAPRGIAIPASGTGSTDMGDVSHVVPSIHPWLAIVEEGAALCHEHRFAEAAATDAAGAHGLVAAKALARTAVEFLADADLRAAVTPSGGIEDGDVDALSLGVLQDHVHELPALGHLGQSLEAPVPELERDARPVEDDAEHLRPRPATRARDAERAGGSEPRPSRRSRARRACGCGAPSRAR